MSGLHILSSLVLNSTMVLDFTISDGRLFHIGIFLIANEFCLMDLLARFFFLASGCDLLVDYFQ